MTILLGLDFCYLLFFSGHCPVSWHKYVLPFLILCTNLHSYQHRTCMKAAIINHFCTIQIILLDLFWQLSSYDNSITYLYTSAFALYLIPFLLRYWWNRSKHFSDPPQLYVNKSYYFYQRLNKIKRLANQYQPLAVDEVLEVRLLYDVVLVYSRFLISDLKHCIIQVATLRSLYNCKKLLYHHWPPSKLPSSPVHFVCSGLSQTGHWMPLWISQASLVPLFYPQWAVCTCQSISWWL